MEIWLPDKLYKKGCGKLGVDYLKSQVLAGRQPFSSRSSISGNKADTIMSMEASSIR
jgi:hypothetical protein